MTTWSFAFDLMNWHRLWNQCHCRQRIFRNIPFKKIVNKSIQLNWVEQKKVELITHKHIDLLTLINIWSHITLYSRRNIAWPRREQFPECGNILSPCTNVLMCETMTNTSKSTMSQLAFKNCSSPINFYYFSMYEHKYKHIFIFNL